jgi:hypothetical protein
MALTTKDLRVNGYPPLDVIMAHYDAIPVLVDALRRMGALDVLEQWERTRNVDNGARRVDALTQRGSLAIEYALEFMQDRAAHATATVASRRVDEW